MKKLFLIATVVLLAAFALSACGVAQDEYDRVVSELAAAQSQIDNLESQLESVNDNNVALQDELDAAVAEYDSLYAMCEETETDCDTIIQELDDMLKDNKPYLDILIEMSGPAITGDGLGEATLKSAVETYVMETEDDILQARYDDWAKSPTNRSMAYALFWYVLSEMEDQVFGFMPTPMQ
jgi:outer membrane murein-binding lipoprotein Lpp